MFFIGRELYISPEDGAKKLINASVMLAVKDYSNAYRKLILGKITKEDLDTMKECCNYLKTILGEEKGQIYINMAQDKAGVQIKIEEK